MPSFTSSQMLVDKRLFPDIQEVKDRFSFRVRFFQGKGEKPYVMLGYRGNYNYSDAIRNGIINSINNENYNNYFPVSNPVNDGWRRDEKNSKKNPLVILPSRRDEN